MIDWERLGTNKGNELDDCSETLMVVWTVEMASRNGEKWSDSFTWS